MARKRGGLAGIWDRNKKIIQPLATLAAGALTGGAALPALLGAGMSGLDRPGRRGIGFDVGAGARGALAGAGTGALGAAGAAKLGSMFGAGQTASAVAQPELLGQLASSEPTQAGQMTARMMSGGTPSLPAAGRMAQTGLQGQLAGAAGPAQLPMGGAARSIASNVSPQPMSRLSQLFGAARNIGGDVARFGRENASWLGPAAGGVAEYLGEQAAADVGRERNELERQRFERERQQQEALAALLMPLFQQQARRVGGMG